MRTLLPGMKKLVARFSLLSTLALLTLASAVPALAQDHGGEPTSSGGGGTDVWEVATWSLVGVAIFCLALGILYLFKRQVGGFPENPSWVAPISIQRSRDLPSEPDTHGHDDHGDSHAPAH